MNIKINTIQNYSLTPAFGQKNIPSAKSSNKKTQIATVAGIAITAASILAYRGYNNSYRVKLAKRLSKELGEKIYVKNLKSVMTKSELLKELPKLSEQNYVASENNIKNGIFLADLHSHSNYSDGQISVEKLLDEAAQYGDKLNKMNGKKFIFALSDHDGIDGVKEALKIIAQNPKKYENIKFVPAAEISFVYPCHKDSVRFKKFNSDVQMPEMLIYNINPFSNTTKEFFNKIYTSRNSQIRGAVNEVNFYYHSANFSMLEYEKYFAHKNKNPFLLNQHWRLWNYMHTKSRVAKMAEEQGLDQHILYRNIVKELKNNHKGITPYNLDKYIQEKGIQTESKMIDSNISRILKEKYFPHKEGERTVSTEYEIQYKDIIEYAKKENAILGFAHPAFTMQNFPAGKELEEMQEIVKQAKGRIKFAEKYHQAYPIGTEVEESELKKYNEILDKLELINIGGRDNHKDTFIPF